MAVVRKPKVLGALPVVSLARGESLSLIKQRYIPSFSFVSLVSLVLVAAFAEASATPSYPTHYGRSPTGFETIAHPSDTFVVTDRNASNLDRYMYRSGSGAEISISIPIRRYVGDVEKLKANGLISDTFRIYLPAYDVDANTSPVFDCDGDGIPEQFNPEVNEVYFNDELIGTLTGDNQLWKFNDQFELPISKLRLPTSPGGIGYNTLKVRIDTANANVPLSGGGTGCQVWATEVDWVGIKFEATSPVMLIAGLFGSPDSFANSGYQSKLMDELGLPSEIITHAAATPSLSACTGAAPSVFAHAVELRENIKAVAESYGTDSVHLVAHSMGGLDARAFLNTLAPSALEVQVGTMGGQPVISNMVASSLATHGSPHLGTAFADYGVANLMPSVGNLAFSDICDLTTHTMQQVNPIIPIPGDVNSLLIGGDADHNGDGNLDDTETAGNQVGNPMANWLYHLLSETEEIHLENIGIDPMSGMPIIVTVRTPTLVPEENDTMVTINSALGAAGGGSTLRLVGTQGKNHGTIIDDEVQSMVINEGLNGSLNWRLK